MDPKSSPINYLYFGGFFALLIFIVAGSIFTKENLGGSHFFFFLYALGQVTLEILLLIFAAFMIRKYLGKICFALFIGLTFFALVLHLLDFMMDRILDLSIWQSLKIFVFDESWENFLFLLDASGIPLWAWIGIFAALVAIPIVGFLLYKVSEILTHKRPLLVRKGLFVQACLCIPCALLFWDFSASKVIHPDVYTSFIKSLPWKFTFIQPQTVLLSLPGSLQPPLHEDVIAAAVEADKTVLAKRPNIYLFVVESLRADSITEKIAPHLAQFKQDYSSIETALSNGNGTHLSWYSIFHSQFSYFWNYQQKERKRGSPALQLLKKWGYQVRLYSSAQLGYYGMDKVLFGENLQLLDSKHYFSHSPPLQAADSDAEALAQMQKDIAADPSLQEGQIFVVFWDCTHFDYCWPKNWTPPFTPFAQELAYFQAFQSNKSIAQIKNRYWNSVNFMDSLFGQFLEKLPRKDEAIVVFTGDHGEEFFDHGHLFHNSHLTHEQMNVPLYFKLGEEKLQCALASQMDIFPTLIDYLGRQKPFYLEGNSLFQKPKWPYAITARFNAGGIPYEFCIHNGKNKLIVQFPNTKQMFHSKSLRILSLRTVDDKTVPDFKNNVAGWVDQEFGSAISRLFSAPSEDL